MKNSLILSLSRSFANVGANTIDIADAYKLLKMKSEILKARRALDERMNELSKDTFTDEEAVLSSDPKSEKSPVLIEKIKRYNKLCDEMLKEDTPIANVKRVSFKTWQKFTKENDLKLGLDEADLEGVFFDAYEDESAKEEAGTKKKK